MIRAGVAALLVTTAAAGQIPPAANWDLADAETVRVAPDKGFLQVIDGDGRIGFSRALIVANPQTIRRYHANFSGPEPPLLDHDGIDDAFAEKGSTVRYWHEGRWLELMGSD